MTFLNLWAGLKVIFDSPFSFPLQAQVKLFENISAQLFTALCMQRLQQDNSFPLGVARMHDLKTIATLVRRRLNVVFVNSGSSAFRLARVYGAIV